MLIEIYSVILILNTATYPPPLHARASCTIIDRYTMCNMLEHHTVHHVQDGDKNQLKQMYNTFTNIIKYKKLNTCTKKPSVNLMGSYSLTQYQKKEYKRFCSGFNEYLITANHVYYCIQES